MNRMVWWLTEKLALLLNPDERNAVLGDLAETRTLAIQGFMELCGLVARRQAALWRKCVLQCAMGIAVCTVLCFLFVSKIYGYLAASLAAILIPVLGHISYSMPRHPFSIDARLALLGGLFLASPFVLWRFWLTASPPAMRHKIRYEWPFVALMTALLFAGGVFAFQVVLPQLLRLIISLSSGPPMITINESWNLAIATVAGVGLLFEAPGLCFLLYLKLSGAPTQSVINPSR